MPNSVFISDVDSTLPSLRCASLSTALKPESVSLRLIISSEVYCGSSSAGRGSGSLTAVFSSKSSSLQSFSYALFTSERVRQSSRAARSALKLPQRHIHMYSSATLPSCAAMSLSATDTGIKFCLISCMANLRIIKSLHALHIITLKLTCSNSHVCGIIL